MTPTRAMIPQTRFTSSMMLFRSLCRPRGTGARQLRFQRSLIVAVAKASERHWRVSMGPVRNWTERGTVNAGLAAFLGEMTVGRAIGLFGSVALLPLVALQGAITRRRVPCLPPVKVPCRGLVPGHGAAIRMRAIGDSTVAGVGLTHGEETVAAATARALARQTGRPVAWQGHGLSGATVSEAAQRLLPRIAAEPADLLVIAFGVNDTIAYRSPWAFADDLAALVTAARSRIGEAAVVIAGVAPLSCFPALPWPLRTILNWRSPRCRRRRRSGRPVARLAVEQFSNVRAPTVRGRRFPSNVGPRSGDELPPSVAAGRAPLGRGSGGPALGNGRSGSFDQQNRFPTDPALRPVPMMVPVAAHRQDPAQRFLCDW